MGLRESSDSLDNYSMCHGYATVLQYYTILRGQSLLRITRKSVQISVILVCTVYAASLFTLAPPRLMPEAQNSYSESSYSSAESLVIESEK